MNNDSSDNDLAYHMVYSDSDTEDDNLLRGDLLKIILYIATKYDNDERSSFYTRDRCQWERHVQELRNEGAFSRMYRMSIIAFNKLCLMLEPYLLVDTAMSTLRTKKPIGTPELSKSHVDQSRNAKSESCTTRCCTVAAVTGTGGTLAAGF
jgi:hypothetical protein